MAELDYKTITAPNRLKRVKGVKGTDELLAYTIGEIIEAQAAEGWLYQGADKYVVEEKPGFFSRPRTVERTLMIFARERRKTMKAISQQSREAFADPVAPAAPPAQDYGAAQDHGAAPAPEVGGVRRG